MPPVHARIRALVPSLVIGLLVLPLPLACQDADRPLLSDRAREIIEAEGADDAIGELAMLLGTGSDTYVIDVDGMIELGRAYVADDDIQAGITVLTVTTYADPSSADAIVALADAYAQREDAITASVYYEQALALDPTHSGARAGMEATGGALPAVPELPEDEAPPASQAEDAQEAVHEAADDDVLARVHEGPRRDDLGRFKGRYRAPADHEARPRRVYWIAETCLGSGYLMMGAEWGDVAPRVFDPSPISSSSKPTPDRTADPCGSRSREPRAAPRPGSSSVARSMPTSSGSATCSKTPSGKARSVT